MDDYVKLNKWLCEVEGFGWEKKWNGKIARKEISKLKTTLYISDVLIQ